MADSIKERILQHMLTVLSGISVANGYQNDLARVERFHLQPMDQTESPILEIKMGSDVPGDESDITVESRVLQVLILVKVRHDTSDDGQSSDTIFNRLAQDVYRALLLDKNRGGLATDTRFQGSDEVTLDEGATQGQQVLTFDVPYRHQWGDMTT